MATLEISKRVEVLVLCVCIAYDWTMFLVVTLEQAGKRREIEGPSRQELSLFQLVIRYFRHLLARGEEMPREFRLSSPHYEG